MSKTALIIIDMENGFLNEESAQCIKMAKATLPACARVADYARQKDIPVFFVNRVYRPDGSDVEHTRFKSWYEGGKAMSNKCDELLSCENPGELSPEDGDYVIIKPRFSAFFMTELDLILRRLGIENVILIGTTTPNCVRSTCYDAISLDYNVVIIEDCCSSQTAEIQKANIADMKNIGADIITSEEFLNMENIMFSDSLNQCRNIVRNNRNIK
ncbi:MAG: cysteine hydrolase [Clostridia bacterium]|nr:cysteine hydrolase [Clostridia bacterium]